MKYLFIVFLLVGCGMNHNARGTANLQVKTPEEPIIVRHEVVLEEELFRESCERQYADISQEKVQECIDKKLEIIEGLISTLNNKGKKDE